MKAANLSLVTTRTNWIHSWAGCIFNKDRLTSSIITHLCEMAIRNHGPACSSHLGITIGFIHTFGERLRFPSSCFLRNFMLVSHCFLFAKLACYYQGDILGCDREIQPMWFVKSLLQNLFCSTNHNMSKLYCFMCNYHATICKSPRMFGLFVEFF